MSKNISIINNTDLKPGMEVLIPAGETVFIDGDVYPSRVSPGSIVAETTLGPIYFAGDLTSKIVMDDESGVEDTRGLVGAL